MSAPYLETYPPARSQFRTPRRAAVTGLIVVHTAESALDVIGEDTGAENVARFIRNRSTAGSYHEVVDSDSAVYLVNLDSEAFHDGTGTNRHSYGLSFALRESDWAGMDPALVRDFLDQGAKAASRMSDHCFLKTGKRIPSSRVQVDLARAGVPGFLGHGELDPGRRSDPGVNFPWDKFLSMYELEESRKASTTMSKERALQEITLLYATVLLRDADPAGLEYWSDLLVGGADLNTVKVEFLLSALYEARRDVQDTEPKGSFANGFDAAKAAALGMIQSLSR